MSLERSAILITAVLLVINGTQAQPRSGNTVPVTADNFNRAESHLYFSNSIKGGGSGKFHHVRVVLPIDHQTVIRGNRDTLYSSGVRHCLRVH